MSDYKSIKDIDFLHSIIEKLYIENNNLKKNSEDLENTIKEIKSNIPHIKYYEKNKEKIIKNNGERRKNLSKEKKNEYQRNWYHNKKLKENKLKENKTI